MNTFVPKDFALAYGIEVSDDLAVLRLLSFILTPDLFVPLSHDDESDCNTSLGVTTNCVGMSSKLLYGTACQVLPQSPSFSDREQSPQYDQQGRNSALCPEFSNSVDDFNLVNDGDVSVDQLTDMILHLRIRLGFTLPQNNNQNSISMQASGTPSSSLSLLAQQTEWQVSSYPTSSPLSSSLSSSTSSLAPVSMPEHHDGESTENQRWTIISSLLAVETFKEILERFADVAPAFPLLSRTHLPGVQPELYLLINKDTQLQSWEFLPNAILAACFLIEYRARLAQSSKKTVWTSSRDAVANWLARCDRVPL
eukprot:gene7063-7643_t